MEQIKVSVGEWVKQGIAKFGPNRNLWQFKCPNCRTIQRGIDFLTYRAMGATTSTAYQKCVGCFNGKKDALEDDTVPGCLFSAGAQPNNAPLILEYGPGHSMPIMDFADE